MRHVVKNSFDQNVTEDTTDKNIVEDNYDLISIVGITNIQKEYKTYNTSKDNILEDNGGHYCPDVTKDNKN